MSKIINIQAIDPLISRIKQTNQSIVLVGGCFDIIHIGHVKFLQKAKKLGDVLFVLLESDEKVKKLKGKNRPLFNQQERANVLSELKSVDYVVNLPLTNNDKDYEEIISIIKPDYIAVTENDPLLLKKRKQAEKIKTKLQIIPYVKTFSSSRLADLLGIY